MPPTLKVFTASVGLSILHGRFSPKSTLGHALESVLLFFVLYFAYAVWAVLLYPRYFSPLRKLPEAPDAHWLLGQTQRIIREASGMPMRDWVESVPNNGTCPKCLQLLANFRGVPKHDQVSFATRCFYKNVSSSPLQAH